MMYTIYVRQTRGEWPPTEAGGTGPFPTTGEIQMTTTTIYRARFQSSTMRINTAFYATREAAQDALANRIGGFNYLGSVAGDCFDGSACDYASRNGGAVSIETRAVRADSRIARRLMAR